MRHSEGQDRERGAVTFKAIVSVLVLILLAHTAYVFIPIYIAVYDFRSQVEREANYGAVKDNQAIEKSLLEYAKERGIPMDRKHLRINRMPDKITITADYTMPVRTLLYTYNWQITTEKTGILF